jgi:hypothetical protein
MGRNECVEGMDFMKDWKTWRASLHDAIQEGKKYGMTDEEIKDWAVEIGDYLAKKVCAGTPEEVLLKELWDVATTEQRKTLAALIFKLVG